MIPLGEVAEVWHGADHSSTQRSGHREGTCGCTAMGGCCCLFVKDAQGSRMDFLPLCLHTRAQKSGGLGGGRGNVGELVTGSKGFAPKAEEN